MNVRKKSKHHYLKRIKPKLSIGLTVDSPGAATKFTSLNGKSTFQ